MASLRPFACPKTPFCPVWPVLLSSWLCLERGKPDNPPGLCPAGSKLPCLLGPGLCLRPWQALGVFAEGSPMGFSTSHTGAGFPSMSPCLSQACWGSGMQKLSGLVRLLLICLRLADLTVFHPWGNVSSG